MKKRLVTIVFFLTTISNLFCLTKDEIDFFETKIRPALIENCYKCHSSQSKKIKGKLLLDDKSSTLKGGDTGPSIVPGDVEKSLLIKSIRYTDKDLQMPPDGKLSPTVISNFEKWVKMGAPDTRDGVTKDVDWNKSAREHWAYKPLQKPTIPIVNSKWISNPVDNFIYYNLKKNGLIPSLIAEKRILIRRAYYDLIGLPPSEKEVLDFLNDTSDDSYEKLVDRLLASPRYGERWARHWMDTARYSDTSGTVNANQESRYTYSYTYRDYVIRSFNEDKPFDQFIREQIAADKIKDVKRENLAALGFLTLGKNSNNANDVIDDRIDVIFKGFMATTVVCARCHDHKFDPVSTKDYYAIHGIFSSSSVPGDDSKPLLAEIKKTPEYMDYVTKREKIELEIEEFIDVRYAAAVWEFRTNTFKNIYGGYVLNSVVESNRVDYIRDSKLNSRMIQKWAASLNVKINVSKKTNLKGEKSKDQKISQPAFYPLARMFKVPESEFRQTFLKMIESDSEDINPYLLHQIRRVSINNMRDLAMVYQTAVNDSISISTNVLGGLDFRNAIFKNNGPLDISRDGFSRYYSDNGKTMKYDNELRQQRGRIITHEISHPAAPARAMAMVDRDKSTDSQVLIKGDPGTRGPTVPRRFLELFSYINPNNFTNGSGRLELANAVADPRNPLTPRVIVNRIWQFHFGEGLVRTPDDFGILTDVPTQYDLLNYLASKFIEDGWSIKKMHKLLMTSSTYKQTVNVDSHKALTDSYNKYYWRMNILKLDFETLRDTILYMGGRLDLTTGGQPINLTSSSLDGYSVRRTIYGLIDRGRLPEVFSTFDFATPEMTTGKRFQTTVPKQALFLMNNPLVIEQVRNMITRPEFLSIKRDEEKIKSLYSICFQREPTTQETKIGIRYIQWANMEDMSEVKKEYNWRYGYRVVDSYRNLSRFFEFSNFSNDSYKLTNFTSGVVIYRTGGDLPANNTYAIREWTSSRGGSFQFTTTVKIKPQLKELLSVNLIVLRNGKVIASNIITNAVNEISIKLDASSVSPKDKFEFCVVNGSRKSLSYLANIKIEEIKDENSLTPIIWNSQTDFRSPIKRMDRELDSWERYAHILILSNEMVFVN